MPWEMARSLRQILPREIVRVKFTGNFDDPPGTIVWKDARVLRVAPGKIFVEMVASKGLLSIDNKANVMVEVAR